jgi:hypothetical protein
MHKSPSLSEREGELEDGECDQSNDDTGNGDAVFLFYIEEACRGSGPSV